MRPAVSHPTDSRYFYSEDVPDIFDPTPVPTGRDNLERRRCVPGIDREFPRTRGHAPREKEKRRFTGRGVGPFQAQGAAESDASVCLGVRSHVPGTRRDRAPADEAGIRKAKPPIETPAVGIR